MAYARAGLPPDGLLCDGRARMSSGAETNGRPQKCKHRNSGIQRSHDRGWRLTVDLLAARVAPQGETYFAWSFSFLNGSQRPLLAGLVVDDPVRREEAVVAPLGALHLLSVRIRASREPALRFFPAAAFLTPPAWPSKQQACPYACQHRLSAISQFHAPLQAVLKLRSRR